MARGQWSDRTWNVLVQRIDAGEVTPVIGAGASISIIGSGAAVARRWADDTGYPFGPPESLAEIAQYVATTVDRASPGEYIRATFRERLERVTIPDIVDPNDPYRYLPSLPIPIWITTNFDDLIWRGLLSRAKTPKVSVGRWTPPDLFWDTTQYDLGDSAPSSESPLVFHLHGRYEDPPSMVITTADYLEFLEQMASSAEVLPPVVEAALAGTSLLFIGYSFGDTNLQLLLRQWRLPNKGFAVQLPPPHISENDLADYDRYFRDYVRDLTGADIEMFWGTASEFCAALSERRTQAGAT